MTFRIRFGMVGERAWVGWQSLVVLVRTLRRGCGRDGSAREETERNGWPCSISCWYAS